MKGTLNTSRQLSRALEEGTSAMVPRMAWYAPDDGLQGHPVHLDICRIHEEVVGGDADHSHQNRTQHRPDQGALTALVLAVHQAGAQHEHGPPE